MQLKAFGSAWPAQEPPVPAQMWASPGRRCGRVPAQMWASPGADVGESGRRCGRVPVINGVRPHSQVVVDDDVVPRSNLHSLTALHNSLISM